MWPQEAGGEVHSVSDLVSPFAPITVLEMLFGGWGVMSLAFQRNYIGERREFEFLPS